MLLMSSFTIVLIECNNVHWRISPARAERCPGAPTMPNEAAVQAAPSPERPSDAPRSSLGLAPCAMLYDKHSLRCPNVVFTSSTRPLQDVGRM